MDPVDIGGLMSHDRDHLGDHGFRVDRYTASDDSGNSRQFLLPLKCLLFSASLFY
jgi:hypothetical protein